MVDLLLKEFPGQFGFAVSHTTREPRENLEVDGQHYHFTNKPDMEAMIEQGAFLEHALVHDNLYGTSLAAIESVDALNKICVLDIDVQGHRKITEDKRFKGQTVSVAILPDNMSVLRRRLKKRGANTDGEIWGRIST